MDSKPLFAEDYKAYLLKVEPSLQKSDLVDLELLNFLKQPTKVAGPCNGGALSPLDWWSES